MVRRDVEEIEREYILVSIYNVRNIEGMGPLTYSSGVICRTSRKLWETIKEYLLYLQTLIKHTYICMVD